MKSSASEERPVRLTTRTLAQRRLISSIIDELAGQRTDQDSFGRVVRVVHATAATALPAHADGDLARRRLMRLCETRLNAPQTLTHAAAS